MVDVLCSPVFAAADAVIVVPEIDTVSQSSPTGRDTVAVTPVESPVMFTVFAILFDFKN
jgi:hypothetical protein